MSEPVRVVVVDDHAMFRRGVSAELGTTGAGRVEVVAEAADVDEAVAAVQQHRPAVVVVQHIDENFADQFAKWLGDQLTMPVRAIDATELAKVEQEASRPAAAHPAAAAARRSPPSPPGARAARPTSSRRSRRAAARGGGSAAPASR